MSNHKEDQMRSAEKTSPEIYIRWLIRRDLDEVIQIEQDSFAGGGWSRESFTTLLRKRNMIGMVAEVGDEITGFMVYELNRREIIVHNLAVAKGWRKRGVATAMIGKLKQKLSIKRRCRLTVGIHESNLDAQKSARALGFVCRATMGTGNAYIFSYAISKWGGASQRITKW